MKEKTEMLIDHEKMMAEMTMKLLEGATKERMELISQHYQELERSKLVLDSVQTTYRTQLMEYEVQAKATTNLIKQLKNEKEATQDKTKLGIKRIR